jgi:hypothetical protein
MMHIRLSGSAIGGGAVRQLDIFIPSLKITSSTVAVGGADVITQSFDCQAFLPEDGQGASFPTPTLDASEMYIQLTNEYPFNVFRNQNREY